MCLLDKSRVTVSAFCFQICCSIGRRKASMSSAALDVALNAPQMIRAALAWMLCNMSSAFLVYVRFFPFSFVHIEQAYIIWGSAVPSYIFLRSMRLAPHVELPRLLNAFTVFIAFRLTSSMCGFHVSLASIVSPRYLQLDFGLISPQMVWIGWFMSIFLRVLVKCVSWNLSGAKTDACVFAHCCAFWRVLPRISHVGWFMSIFLRVLVKCVSWNLSGAKTDACVFAHCCAFWRVLPRISHVSSVVSAHAKIAMSSMYPVGRTFASCLHISMRSAL
ncbi:hypothetical protein DM02DRAFT_100858 [Periconia macrospinosa]|uniref:Uncharacterized protein n=1 Tax=Periconia macrospinosa TaxID=97972 RepID=A0A2V1DI94_9PLEO|nr:hypothetical protein DM02DRAFT_100858 [Periconia macrospinosa]